jgi:hypothetical protein
LIFLDAYQGRELNISWHEKLPIEYNHESIQVEGYKMTGIETSNDAIQYSTGGIPLFGIFRNTDRGIL